MTTVYIRKIDLCEDRTPSELTAFRSAEVRRLLADCLRDRYKSWALAKTDTGKPYLVTDGIALPLQISLSHSGNWVVCALSDATVGVDAQKVRPISPAVLERFMPEAVLDEGENDRSKTRLWTCYEACLKRYGSRAEMVKDAPNQRYDSIDLSDAVVTVCHGDDAVEWYCKEQDDR